MTVDLQLLVVPCKRVYNCIVGRPFAITLDIVVSPVHLKMKYNNIHDELVMINIDLYGGKRIYKALEQDQKEDEIKVVKINVAFVVMQLRSVKSSPSR